MATSNHCVPLTDGGGTPRLQSLLDRHGELMPGRELRAFFHFGSERAFRRAATAGRLPVAVFPVAGRRGWFARTRDVAAWLEAAASTLDTN